MSNQSAYEGQGCCSDFAHAALQAAAASSSGKPELGHRLRMKSMMSLKSALVLGNQVRGSLPTAKNWLVFACVQTCELWQQAA